MVLLPFLSNYQHFSRGGCRVLFPQPGILEADGSGGLFTAGGVEGRRAGCPKSPAADEVT